MVAFHRNMVEHHMSPAEALRAAQLQVRKSYEHPFYWASFVVLGRGW
jgi:CHAT domain-containing protein